MDHQASTEPINSVNTAFESPIPTGQQEDPAATPLDGAMELAIHSQDMSKRCRCPACCTEPGNTYTREYMQDCFYRAVGHYSSSQRADFLKALMEHNKDWKERFVDIEASIARLKAEGHYETPFYQRPRS